MSPAFPFQKAAVFADCLNSTPTWSCQHPLVTSTEDRVRRSSTGLARRSERTLLCNLSHGVGTAGIWSLFRIGGPYTRFLGTEVYRDFPHSRVEKGPRLQERSFSQIHASDPFSTTWRTNTLTTATGACILRIITDPRSTHNSSIIQLLRLYKCLRTCLLHHNTSNLTTAITCLQAPVTFLPAQVMSVRTMRTREQSGWPVCRTFPQSCESTKGRSTRCILDSSL